MSLKEHESIGVGVGVFAVFSVIATIVGFCSDIKDIFFKDNDNTQQVMVTSTVAQEEIQITLMTEKEEITTTEELVTTTEKVTTTTEEITEPPVTEPTIIYLADLEPTDSYNYWKTIEEIDNIGNTYDSDTSHFFAFAYGYNKGYAIYYLGKKYTKLSGTIAISHSSYKDYTMILSILDDDGNSIYETESMDKFTVPIEFSVDVTGIEWLTIQKDGYGVRPILNDWTLE